MDRVNLTLPEELNSEVIALSKKHGVPVVEIIRRFIRLGLLEDEKGPFRIIDDAGQEIIVEMHPPRESANKLQLW